MLSHQASSRFSRGVARRRFSLQLMVVPAVEDLQTRPELRTGWINYSAFDAKSTLQLYAALHARLSTTPCDMDPSIRVALRIQQGRFSMWDMYQRFWKPFGDLLTDMENRGMLVNRWGCTLHSLAAPPAGAEDCGL